MAGTNWSVPILVCSCIFWGPHIFLPYCGNERDIFKIFLYNIYCGRFEIFTLSLKPDSQTTTSCFFQKLATQPKLNRRWFLVPSANSRQATFLSDNENACEDPWLCVFATRKYPLIRKMYIQKSNRHKILKRYPLFKNGWQGCTIVSQIQSKLIASGKREIWLDHEIWWWREKQENTDALLLAKLSWNFSPFLGNRIHVKRNSDGVSSVFVLYPRFTFCLLEIKNNGYAITVQYDYRDSHETVASLKSSHNT